LRLSSITTAEAIEKTERSCFFYKIGSHIYVFFLVHGRRLPIFAGCCVL